MNIEDRIFQSLDWEFAYHIEREAIALRPKCESEIEVMYGVAASILCKFSWQNSFKLVLPSEEAENEDAVLLLMPQYSWQNYRIDWVWRLRSKEKNSLLFIECDGHQFHERTKEQAERDRSKDRAIQKAGIPILRFTGREIFRDVQKCVFETIEFLDVFAREISNG